MKLYFLFLLAIFFPISTLAEGEYKLLKGVAPYKAPLAYNLEDDIVGSEVETVKKIAQNLGYTIKFKLEPWDDAIRDVQIGKFDFIINIEKKLNIENAFYFSAPTFSMTSVFYKRKKDDISFKYLDNLKPYKIGIARDHVYRGEFQKLLAGGVFDTYNLSGNNIDLQGLLMVATKKIDLYLCLHPICEYLVRIHKDKYQEMQSLDFIDKNVEDKRLYRIAFPKYLKNSEKLNDMFNSEIVNFIDSSTHRAILQKYGLTYDLK